MSRSTFGQSQQVEAQADAIVRDLTSRWAWRRDAARARLRKLRDAKVLWRILAITNPEGKVRAAVSLANAGLRDALEPLAARLDTDGSEESVAATIGLGSLGDIRLVPGLTRLLEHGDPFVRTAAALALARMGAAAAPALPSIQVQLDRVTPSRWALIQDDENIVYDIAIHRIRAALRALPAELEAASAPEGLGTELEASGAPAGTGTELLPADGPREEEITQ